MSEMEEITSNLLMNQSDLRDLFNQSELLNLTDVTQGGVEKAGGHMSNMFSTLIQIFLTIKLGWLTGFFNIIEPQQAKGLNIFVGKYSLPVLIFVSLSSLDFSQVNWSFLIAILISKSVIFIGVGVIELLVNRPRDISRAAIFSILCTQTNDFGMGLPILQSVYGPEHEFVALLYLVAPISLLILNPIGFTFLEAERSSKLRKITKEPPNKLKDFITVLSGLALNPIVNMTVLGVLANLIFSRQIPDVMLKLFTSIGSCFGSLAPFTLGLSMFGKLDNIRGPNLKTIFGLLVVKSLVTPLITHITIEQVSKLLTGDSDSALSNFGVLYGSIPPALGVDSYAAVYEVSPELISSTIVITTIISAPLMYLSANILTVLKLDQRVFRSNLMTFTQNISNMSIMGGMLILMIFLVSGRFRNMPHSLSLSLLIYALMTGFGGVMWTVIPNDSMSALYFQAVVHSMGLYTAKVCVPLLAFVVYLTGAGRCSIIQKYKWLILFISPAVGAAITSALAITQQPELCLVIPFGPSQDIVNMAVDLLCFGLLAFFLALQSKNSERKSMTEATSTGCTEENSPQMFRHSLLLILYAGAFVSNIGLSGYRLSNSGNEPFPGLYQVLVYIDVLLWTGQGLLFTAVFFLDCKFILTPISRLSGYIVKFIKNNRDIIPTTMGLGLEKIK